LIKNFRNNIITRRGRMFHPPRIRRGAATAIRTRRHSAKFGAAAAAFFLFKKAVCLLNRNRNIIF
jgi:hypothetical protein